MLNSKSNSPLQIVFLGLILSICCIPVSYARCGKNINDGIQKIIDDHRLKYQIPGIEVSISCPGENLPRDFVSGTTTINGESPLKADNLFQIGSETKSFTATILLQLEGQGLLSIEDPVSKWLPQLLPAWKNTTIKQLLNHTSGLFNYTESEDFLAIVQNSGFTIQFTPDELVNFAANKPPYFEPGHGWHYSNTNYVLAGMVNSAVTGNTVEQEMNHRLFEPLHLSNTYYLSRAYDDDILLRMAHGYMTESNETPIDTTQFNISWADSAGAIISTSHDTAIWLRKLLFAKSLLPYQQRKELMSLVDIENGQPLPRSSQKNGYGLAIGHGFDASGHEYWVHGGNTPGYDANMAWLSCQDVVLTTIINRNGELNGNETLFNDLVAYIQKTDPSKRCSDKHFGLKKPFFVNLDRQSF